MRAFAEKPNAAQQTLSTKLTIPPAHFGQSREANSILNLQRTIGNQSVQRPLEANTVNVKGDSTNIGVAHFGHDFSRIPVHASADLVRSRVMRASFEPSVATNPAGALATLAHAGAGGGHGVPQALRSRIEVAIGADLGGVRIHTGGGSQQAARMLNARAFTVGDDIHFAQGQYRPGNQEGDRLIAHELVHTMQQGPSYGVTAQPKLDVSQPGDAAEVEADMIADSIIAGKAESRSPTPMRVSAARKAISRTDFKNGDATFKVDPYAESDADNGKDTARKVGVTIGITYKSAETYKSNKLSFVQTMKPTKDGKPYLFENMKPRATDAKAGEAGWAIDQLAGRKSPLYVEDGESKDVGEIGYRKSKTDFKDASLSDGIKLNRAIGQTVTVDAVSFAFDVTNSKYLGGISWGFATDAKGTTKKKAAALQSAGDPSGIQKEALKKWNEQAALADTSKRNAPDQEKVVVP